MYVLGPCKIKASILPTQGARFGELDRKRVDKQASKVPPLSPLSIHWNRKGGKGGYE